MPLQPLLSASTSPHLPQILIHAVLSCHAFGLVSLPLRSSPGLLNVASLHFPPPSHVFRPRFDFVAVHDGPEPEDWAPDEPEGVDYVESAQGLPALMLDECDGGAEDGLDAISNHFLCFSIDV